MAEVGIAFGAVGTVSLLAEKLSNLNIHIKDFGLLPDNLDSSIKSFKSCQECVERIHSTLVKDQKHIAERATDTFRSILNRVDESLRKGDPIVKNLLVEYTRKSTGATAGGSSQTAGDSSGSGQRPTHRSQQSVGDRRVKKRNVFTKADKLKAELEKLDLIWKEAQDAIDLVDCNLATIISHHETSSKRFNEAQSAIGCIGSDIAAIRESHEMSSDKYRRHFDEPRTPNEAVLDFSGDTMEAELKRAVLSNSSRARVTAALSSGLVGAVGMGGVGKTVALQRLCWESDVRKKYSHGVFFLSLGQNVTEKDVVEGVAHFVVSSGGERLAKEITVKTSADSAAKQASLWFRGLCTLFVVPTGLVQ